MEGLVFGGWYVSFRVIMAIFNLSFFRGSYIAVNL